MLLAAPKPVLVDGFPTLLLCGWSEVLLPLAHRRKTTCGWWFLSARAWALSPLASPASFSSSASASWAPLLLRAQPRSLAASWMIFPPLSTRGVPTTQPPARPLPRHRLQLARRGGGRQGRTRTKKRLCARSALGSMRRGRSCACWGVCTCSTGSAWTSGSQFPASAPSASATLQSQPPLPTQLPSTALPSPPAKAGPTTPLPLHSSSAAAVAPLDADALAASNTVRTNRMELLLQRGSRRGACCMPPRHHWPLQMADHSSRACGHCFPWQRWSMEQQQGQQ
mmetsp:Transcript_4959/g.11020  ORF Transcript_4959/g.11020 Transcript_4959/m.11020 type:complete len:282 (+) Transcript_4959:320-1165(+)